MKASITIFILFLSLVSFITKAQLIANAGPDVVVCSDWYGVDTLQIGGSPSASGGVPPYTYTWETEYEYAFGTLYASNFLNDTSLANPSVVYAEVDVLVFTLTVTDSQNNTAVDSVIVGFTNWGTHLGYVTIEINEGDSVYCSGVHNITGGFPPYEYLWRPNHGLSDSTSLSFWAKPTHSVAYYVTVTDSSGCTISGAPVYFVNVIPTIVDDLIIETTHSVFPNPSKDKVNLSYQSDESILKTIDFYNTSGQLIYTTETYQNTINISTENLSKGINYFVVNAENKQIAEGKVVVTGN